MDMLKINVMLAIMVTPLKNFPPPKFAFFIDFYPAPFTQNIFIIIKHLHKRCGVKLIINEFKYILILNKIINSVNSMYKKLNRCDFFKNRSALASTSDMINKKSHGVIIYTHGLLIRADMIRYGGYKHFLCKGKTVSFTNRADNRRSFHFKLG